MSEFFVSEESTTFSSSNLVSEDNESNMNSNTSDISFESEKSDRLNEKNGKGRITTSMYYILVILLSISILLFLVLVFLCLIHLLGMKSLNNRNISRTPESTDLEIGMLLNGSYIGKFWSSQGVNDLNFENDVEGLLFFPFGDYDEGEVLYECRVEVTCDDEFYFGDEDEFFHGEDPAEHRRGRILQIAVVGVGVYALYLVYAKQAAIERKASNFIDEKLSGAGMNRKCKSSPAECEEIVVYSTVNEKIWYCEAMCDYFENGEKGENEVKIEVKPERMWCWGVTELNPIKVASHSKKYFSEKCEYGRVWNYECSFVDDKNFISQLSFDDRCENHT